MNPRTLLGVVVVAVTLTLVALTPVRAADPPHWSSANMTVDCTSQCHTLHQAAGGGLTSAAANVVLCQSCHVSSGLAEDLPVNTAERANPNLRTGRHHGFDVAAVHAGFATQAPTNTAMSLRLPGSSVVCSTCHDQHAAQATLGGTPAVSAAKRLTALGSTGMLTSGGTFSGAQGSWYLAQVMVAGTQATARFGYSKDNGNTWFPNNCTPSPLVTTGCLTAGTAVGLDSGIVVTFGTGSYAVGELWQFYGSWPFLRTALDAGANGSTSFCRDCHASWVMDTTAVRTWTGAARSHPVGVAFPSTNVRFRSTPLDGNWEAQGSAGADANPTNDYKLDAGNRIQCLSCHGVHYADSNTQTVDRP